MAVRVQPIGVQEQPRLAEVRQLDGDHELLVRPGDDLGEQRAAGRRVGLVVLLPPALRAQRLAAGADEDRGVAAEAYRIEPVGRRRIVVAWPPLFGQLHLQVGVVG